MPAPVKVGTITIRKDHRYGDYRMKKTEDGWEYLGKVEKMKPGPKANESNPHQQSQSMPPRNNPRKIAAPKEKPIKKTGMTDAEKLAAGWQWIWLNPKTKVLRSPEKLIK